MAGSDHYDQYFDIDENYFPCIDDSAIERGARWDTTYPHQTFVNLLRVMEKMLGGSTNRSLWIHGAYGTGKSQCAYALKKILEVPEEELRKYWNSYDSLKEEKDLLEKLIGHRNSGVVAVSRFSTGGITNMKKFFVAVQESVRDALKKSDRVQYMGENTLKESVVSWLEDETHKNFFDGLLQKPEWRDKFSVSSADEVLSKLRDGKEVRDLISNVIELAEKEGVTAMDIDADRLKTWLEDVVKKNDVAIVFFWDEFSDFFKNNKYSLGDFQKIVALCQKCPFYLVIVTHQTGSLAYQPDESWKIVQQRFDRVEITLPDNIAFELIGHAFKVKDAARAAWNNCVEDLNARLSGSRSAVMTAARIEKSKVIEGIMPIHPMAALVLKNIASAFQSNQRSIFDFIKSSDDSKAFQWFISHNGPKGDNPFLTVDMLWDFFYEKRKDDLSPDIRMILDAYPQHENLRDDERRVLRTILIMQAIDKRLGGEIDVFKPTDQNLDYAFDGVLTAGLDQSCKHLAANLCKDGVLVKTPVGANKYAYGAAVLAGDHARIDEYKKQIREACSKVGGTANLVLVGKLGACLALPPALTSRFADTDGSLPTTTLDFFTRKVNELKRAREDGLFNAVIAFAKNDDESGALKEKIKKAAASEEYGDVIFIDASESPLGENDFDDYVNNSAMARYYEGNNNEQAKIYTKKAEQVLAGKWKDRVSQGSFVIWSGGDPEGERVIGKEGVARALQTIVLKKFGYLPDFEKGLTEAQFKPTQLKKSALCGINQETSGVVAGAEKRVLKNVWKIDGYWEKAETSGLPISKIKTSVEELIRARFDKNEPVKFADICGLLRREYGYLPSNLTAFLTGFLLKEYGLPKYRYIDQNGVDGEMSPDKLAELIANCLNGKNTETCFKQMGADERAFYEVTEIAWGIPKNTLSDTAKAATAVKNKMRERRLPAWCLEYVDDKGVYPVVAKYVDFVQKSGADAYQVAIEIGSESRRDDSLARSLKELLAPENCKKGMLKYIDGFEGGKLRDLADQIGAVDDQILKDVEGLFSVEHSSLWKRETGEDQLRNLIADYAYVKATNDILHASIRSKKEADKKWEEKLEFSICSCEALTEEFPKLKVALEFLKEIRLGSKILPERMKVGSKALTDCSFDLEKFFSDELRTFAKLYKPYLEGLNDEDLSKLPFSDLKGNFTKTRTASNADVKRVADEYRKNQTKTRARELWKSKTGTKSPMEWSRINRTPILKVVPVAEYDSAKKAFDILNHDSATESEFKNALDFLERTTLFEALSDRKSIDRAFQSLLGIYKTVLTDLDAVRDSLERLPINPYEWDVHPGARARIEELAKANYDAGGSDKAIEIINSMSLEELKERLVALVKESMPLGIEILNGGE